MADNYKFFRNLVIAGNVVFVAWITYNGLDEGFQGTLPEKASYVALVVLLIGNIILLNSKKGE